MADDDNVHDMTPDLLRKIQAGIAEILEQTKLNPQMSKDLSELQMTVATMRTDQGRANEQLDKIAKAQQVTGARPIRLISASPSSRNTQGL